MSEVLYRKWRPPRFADIVGQNAITQTLTQAIATGRTSHAYLLCGPRGTGKTSTARVLAKALNCTMRPPGVGDPCGACEVCRAIDQGSFVDLIEIDAASNRGIDDMRDLREKVRYSPTQGKFKVYIIDEAHALTTDAFNAFLKTLEEPPPQTVFVLATTEPHRLPATIVSRCQRFDFRRISPNDVVDRLAEIATAEGVDVSPEVLRTISRASGGSLRDATNLLDQLITSFGANVSIEQVQELLGMGGEDRALALVKHLLTNNTKAALELINTVTSEGQDLRPLHRMTVDFLRAALLMKSGVKDSLELSKEANAELSFASSNTSLEHLLRALRMFGQVSLKFDQPSPLPLELATVELSLDPAPAPVAAVATAPVQPAPAQRPASAPPRGVAPQPRPRPQQQPPAERPAPQPAKAVQATPPPPQYDPSAPIEERLAAQWPTILRALSRVPKRRFDIAALLRSSSKRVIEGNELIVRFSHTSNSERLQDELDDPRCRVEVEKILQEALGEGFTLRVEADDSKRAGARTGNNEPGHLVRAAMNLGGQVVKNGTVAPQAAPVPGSTPDAPVDGPLPEAIVEPTIEPPLVEETPPPPTAEPPLATSDPAPEAVVAPAIEPPLADDAPPATIEPPLAADPAPEAVVASAIEPPPADDAPPAATEPPSEAADPAPEAVAEPTNETPLAEDAPPPATSEPPSATPDTTPASTDGEAQALLDPLIAPAEPVPAAAQPGPMFDFGAASEPSQEKPSVE